MLINVKQLLRLNVKSDHQKNLKRIRVCGNYINNALKWISCRLQWNLSYVSDNKIAIGKCIMSEFPRIFNNDNFQSQKYHQSFSIQAFILIDATTPRKY